VLLWIGLALVGLALVGLVMYMMVSWRSAPAPTSVADLASNPRARRLLADLADLEEAHEAGQIEGATYERQRAEMYEKLKSLQP
jgi:hypothetical protein